MSARRFLAHLVAAATTLALMMTLLFGVVWRSESTFGQRCAKQFPWGSMEHETCVDRLAMGRK